MITIKFYHNHKNWESVFFEMHRNGSRLLSVREIMLTKNRVAAMRRLLSLVTWSCTGFEAGAVEYSCSDDRVGALLQAFFERRLTPKLIAKILPAGLEGIYETFSLAQLVDAKKGGKPS